MQNILIIGATSAIASEVARQLAEESCLLYLVGRSPDKSQLLVDSLEGKCGAWWSADFCDYAKVKELWDEINSAVEHIDTVLIAHGYLGNQLVSESDFDEARSIIEVNLLSVLNWLICITESIESKQIEKIAVITSVAGDRGRPRNYTYGSAKGALGLYLEGLRSQLWKRVEVYNFKLGPVVTPMTESHSKNFSFITKEKAAALIIQGLKSKKYVSYIPAFWRYVLFAVRVMPEAVFQKLKFLSGR